MLEIMLVVGAFHLVWMKVHQSEMSSWLLSLQLVSDLSGNSDSFCLSLRDYLVF